MQQILNMFTYREAFSYQNFNKVSTPSVPAPCYDNANPEERYSNMEQELLLAYNQQEEANQYRTNQYSNYWDRM